MTNSIAVVTTFSASGWDRYGRRMVESFERFWPDEVDLVCYADEITRTMKNRNGRAQFFEHNHPMLVSFKEKYDKPKYRGYPDPGRYNYRYDAVKFCHKPFALYEFWKRRGVDVPDYEWMIWLDADTVTHSPMDARIFRQMCPKHANLVYLGRPHKYSECGFLAFKGNPATAVLSRWIAYYVKGRFAREREWHDSYLFDLARVRAEQRDGLASVNLTPTYLHRKNGGGHPFVNSILGRYMDHLKGDGRKIRGRPNRNDMLVGHDAEYWRRVR